MKSLSKIKLPLATFALCATLCSAFAINAADTTTAFEQNKPLRIAVVNFKTCVEKSKLGQKEQNAFDALKKQMESILLEKEKSLGEVAAKFNDMDYLDSLSPEAETELKRQYRTQTQEFTQQQNQFYQSLSQTNMMIVQKLTESVSKITKEVSKNEKIDLVITEDSTFYYIPAIDISDKVIASMDEAFAKESSDNTTKQPAADIKK